MPTTKKNNLLEYKGHPLMRKENIIYYGSMSDSHIIMCRSSNLVITRVCRLQSVYPYSFSRPIPTYV